MSVHKFIDIFDETGLTRTIANPARIALDKILRTAFDRSGNLRPGAVGMAILSTRDFAIDGIAAVGTGVTVPKRMPQAARAVRIDALAGTAPSGGEFTASLYADGSFVGSVSISSGTTSGGSNLSETIAAGAVLTWNVTAANSAANVGLTLVYRTI